MHTLFFCLFGIIPYYSVPTIECDSVQVNHLFDLDGKLQFDQILYMGQIEDGNQLRDVVLGWRLLKNSRITNEQDKKAWEADPANKDIPYIPTFTPEYTISGKSLIFNDTEANIIRVSFKNLIYETWTQYDIELESRQIFPKEKQYKPTIYHYMRERDSAK